jgi:hypothetical protein
MPDKSEVHQAVPLTMISGEKTYPSFSGVKMVTVVRVMEGKLTVSIGCSCAPVRLLPSVMRARVYLASSS